MEKLDIIFWIFIVIFSATAIITILGITNVIKSIKEKYLTVLVSCLIVEVVGAVILSYNQIDFGPNSDQIISRLTEDLIQIDSTLSDEIQIEEIRSYLEEITNENGKIKGLETELEEYKTELTKTQAELKAIDNVFYANVIKLRLIAEGIQGRTINLVWKQGEKQQVYEVLFEIFKDLSRIGPNDAFSDQLVISTYIEFTKSKGMTTYHLFERFPGSGDYLRVIVDEYATAIFLREYLNLRYPLDT